MTEEIKGEIRLMPVPVYVAIVSDGHESKVVGYYQDSSAAHIAANKAGYGTGEVRPVTVYTTDGIHIYEFKPLGKLRDLDEKENKETLECIRAKLTPAEWEFFQRHS